MDRQNNRDIEKLQLIQEANENTSSRNPGNNTKENQRSADELVKGDKCHQKQGNYGSRQGERGNSGSRGNTGYLNL